MIEDIELRLTRMNETDSETREGPVKRVVFALKGSDKKHSVDWTITLRADEEMPSSYIKQVGKHIGNTTLVSLGKSAHQTEL